jgi:hypothetical protein
VNDAWDDGLPRSPGPRRYPSWQPSIAPDPQTGPVRQTGRPRHAGVPGEGTGPLSLSARAQDEADDLVIRPFLLTGGRTRPAQEGLRVESLIQARPDALRSNLRFEHRQIVELCQRAISLAELAAAVHVPLGVARVLVSDLVADGTVALVQREELSVQMIERIRDRVRAL